MARKNPQIELFKSSRKLNHGGQLSKSNPKTNRPLSTKNAIHLVMRSSHATGAFSMLRRDAKVDGIFHRQAKRFGVKVYRFVNGGNHLHALVRITSRRLFVGFLRAIAGLVARAILGVERGKAKGEKFWDARPFTRIVAWGRAYAIACKYLLKNELEAVGFAIDIRRTKATGPPFAKGQIHWPKSLFV